MGGSIYDGPARIRRAITRIVVRSMVERGPGCEVFVPSLLWNQGFPEFSLEQIAALLDEKGKGATITVPVVSAEFQRKYPDIPASDYTLEALTVQRLVLGRYARVVLVA